jgi:putative glutamine amidotransferase
MTTSHGALIIGMPAQMDPGGDRQYLSRQYSDSIAASGGVPSIIPLLAAAESAEKLAEGLDGLLLTGNNSDLDPGLYQSARLSVCGPAEPLRDQTDFILLEAASRRKIPVLAICFGIQSLNVFLGGSLIQDISTAVNTPIRHSSTKSKDCPSHEISISPGSLLEEIGGRRKVMVNSTHHQAIERPGWGLDIIAQATDGVIESVVGRNSDQWILGVQWHPEKSYGCDEFSRKIFECFLAQCRAVRGD